MSRTKIYRSINALELLAYVFDGSGKRHTIHFTGGTMYPRRVNGTYSTNHPDVIDALERSPMNGKTYQCISKPVAEVPVKKEVVEVEGVTTVQDARDFLLEKVSELTKSKLPNRTAILNAAEKYGYVFVELPVE